MRLTHKHVINSIQFQAVRFINCKAYERIEREYNNTSNSNNQTQRIHKLTLSRIRNVRLSQS